MRTRGVKDMIADVIQDLNRGADLQVLKRKYSFRVVESHKGRNFTLHEIALNGDKGRIVYINHERRWYPAC